MKKNNITKPQLSSLDESLEKTLRPDNLSDFVGQEKVKSTLKLSLQAAAQRKEPLDHLLTYGPPGLGKTTLAYIIAHELGSKLHITAGPAIQRAGDLASLLTNLKRFDVLFIDEIHRINKTVEETLYGAMEDFKLDIILGKGPAARSVRLKLKPFTLVGATTKYGSLTSPLRSRFGLVQKLNFYKSSEIEQILKRSSKVLKIKADPEAIRAIASRSRGTPRVANRLLKRVRDIAQVKYDNFISMDALNESLTILGIDALGLDHADREVLRIIIEHHNGGPVGIQTITNTLSEDVQTIEEVYEPYLMQSGLLARTKQGRIVTDKAYKHLNITKK